MSMQRAEAERPSPFRRRRFVAHRRRRSVALLLLRPLLLAVLMVSLPVMAGVWVASSPRFVLSDLEVEGTSQVTAEQVEKALLPLLGRHLMFLSLRDVEPRLAGNRWVEGASIRKDLPNRLIVEVRERRPVALVRRDGDLYYVDAGGFSIEPYDPSGPVDLVLLSTPSGKPADIAEALRLAAVLESSDVSWTEGLSEIEILGSRDFRVHSASLPFPVLVSAGEIERQLRKLDRVLPEIEHRYESVVAVDLRFSRQIVIQPAVLPRSQEG